MVGCGVAPTLVVFSHCTSGQRPVVYDAVFKPHVYLINDKKSVFVFLSKDRIPPVLITFTGTVYFLEPHLIYQSGTFLIQWQLNLTDIKDHVIEIWF